MIQQLKQPIPNRILKLAVILGLLMLIDVGLTVYMLSNPVKYAEGNLCALWIGTRWLTLVKMIPVVGFVWYAIKKNRVGFFRFGIGIMTVVCTWNVLMLIGIK